MLNLYKKRLNFIKKKKNYQNFINSKFIIFLQINNLNKLQLLKKKLQKNNLNIIFLKKKLFEKNNLYIKNQNSLYIIYLNDDKYLNEIYNELNKLNIVIMYISNIKNLYSNLKFSKNLKNINNIYLNLKLNIFKINLILNKYVKANIT